MSTYYKLVCDDHMECSDAASRTAGGWCFFGYGDETLVPFIIAHCGCRVRIINEHDDDWAKHREWRGEEVDAEVKMADDDGRWK